MQRIFKGTNTGKAKHMASYYYHWERRLYNGLLYLIYKTIKHFYMLMSPNMDPSRSIHEAMKPPKAQFKIFVTLSNANIVV